MLENENTAFEIATNLLWGKAANTKITLPKFMHSDIKFANVLKKENLKVQKPKNIRKAQLKNKKPHFTFVHLKATLAPNTSCLLSLQPQTAFGNVCGGQTSGGDFCVILITYK